MRASCHTLIFALLASQAARAADAPAAPAGLPEAVRKAVAGKELTDSDNLGKPDRATFRELGGGGSVLVGMEAGLAEWFGKEIPYAVRPIYREGAREWTGGAAGNFKSPRVKRTVRVAAKPGYAVGGMWVRSGAGLDKISFRYVRIIEGRLDTTDAYSSDWIGSSDGGSETYIDGGGRPVAGVFASASRDQARNLGLTFARVPLPPPPKKEPPKVTTAAAEPAPGEFGTQQKSKLELEEEVQKAQQEDGTDNTLLIALVAFTVVAVPMLVVGFVMFGRKEEPPTRDPDERSERPAKPRRPRGADEHPARKAEGPTAVARPGLAARIKDYVPATVAAAPPAGSASGEAPPYFLVRATYRAMRNRMARIYVLPAEILVIDAGPGEDMNDVAGVAAATLAGGGLIGALIGGAVGTLVADTRKAKGEAFQQKLDRLDLAGLLEWATEEGNFRARFEDLTGLCVEPPTGSFWREKTRAVGTFRFHHRQRGEYTFEFLIGAEIRGAVELLRRSVGKELRLGGGWDPATACYLEGL